MIGAIFLIHNFFIILQLINYILIQERPFRILSIAIKADTAAISNWVKRISLDCRDTILYEGKVTSQKRSALE